MSLCCTVTNHIQNFSQGFPSPVIIPNINKITNLTDSSHNVRCQNIFNNMLIENTLIHADPVLTRDLKTVLLDYHEIASRDSIHPALESYRLISNMHNFLG
ncbi:unnamed protein product [Chrysodeixis includens]|uniref:Uncharacterized protein n=1 Tax=Chrysodeixis includens TaxID=689277 RepID=A0A9P0FRH8_CHRIL|nr:unnamed protein product [Chrysodeixis includens]